MIRDTSVVNGKEVITLGSYNSLGMSGHPETMQAAIDAIRKYGTSASGSRTLAGEKTLYQQLEKAIADWKHTFAIEVKSNSDAEIKASSNVRKYVELRSDDSKGKVYYLGDLTCMVNDVQYVSWKDWGN